MIANGRLRLVAIKLSICLGATAICAVGWLVHQ